MFIVVTRKLEGRACGGGGGGDFVSGRSYEKVPGEKTRPPFQNSALIDLIAGDRQLRGN